MHVIAESGTQGVIMHVIAESGRGCTGCNKACNS